MQSYYEVNVSKKNTHDGRYSHFFATAPRSITDRIRLRAVLDEIKAKFPEPEFVVSATFVECIGYSVDTSDPALTVDKS